MHTNPSINIRALRLVIAIFTVHSPLCGMALAPIRSVPEGDSLKAQIERRRFARLYESFDFSFQSVVIEIDAKPLIISREKRRMGPIDGMSNDEYRTRFGE